MIEARALTKRYRNTLAVDDLSFTVRPGAVTGFLGPNGSGKSTTMRLLLGLDAPDSGEARINGRRYPELPWPLREVGSMLEAGSVHPGRSARDHLLALALANGLPRRRTDDVLEQTGLAGVAGRRAGTFSLGMGQRLGLATALLGDPGLLILDEPVNGLDPEGIRWLRTLVRSLAAEGRGVLISSHLISEMALTADRIVVIGRGKLIADTSVTELTTRGPAAVQVRSPDPANLARVLTGAGAHVRRGADDALAVTEITAQMVADIAAAQGIAIHELTRQAPSLEEAYMELTRDSAAPRSGPPHGRTPSARSRAGSRNGRA